MRISSVWKAVVGGLAAGTAATATAVQDGRVTVPEVVTIIAAVLGAYGITWAVPNRQVK
jgi:hypothetical protein